MKTLKIYSRKTLEKTGFKKYPFKEITQIIIFYCGKQIASNCFEKVDNKKLRIKFKLETSSRSLTQLKKMTESSARSDSDKFVKQELTKLLDIIKEEKK